MPYGEGETKMSRAKVLIVLTSHDRMGDTGEPTGYYLPELTHPLYALLDAGFDVDISSPKGGAAPMDPRSKDLDDPENKRFLDDQNMTAKVKHSLKLADAKAQDYKAILYPGGHGPMWDLAEDQVSQSLARQIYEHNGVVAAVCHGSAGIVNVKLSSGTYLVAGKQVTGFSNEEEDAAGLSKVMPFMLESLLAERGGKYVKSPLWKEKVVIDGRLITGQNPASAKGIGIQLVKALSDQGN